MGCAHAPAQRPFIFHVDFHVPEGKEYQEHVKFAIETFAQHGIEVRVGDVQDSDDFVLDPSMKAEISRKPQTAAVPVYYVDTVVLREGDDDKEYNGLHWRKLGRNFIAVADGARVSTLAHEIGHALGLGHLTDAKDNVMCGNRTSKKPGFTKWQGKVMRRSKLLKTR